VAFSLILSDRENFIQVTLATNLNGLIKIKAIKKPSVIKLEKFAINLIQGKQ